MQIEMQSKEQGWTLLSAKGTTWCTRRELALDRRKQTFDQSATAIEASPQVRWIEWVLAESAAVTREHRLDDLQGDARNGQEHNFGHRACCLGSKQQMQGASHLELLLS